MTLLTETEDQIKRSGHVVGDIKFIGSKDGKYSCSWPTFCKIADFDYNSGFGAQKVASDLVIMFTDNIVMSRDEYDGSEWWRWSTPVLIDLCPKPIEHLNVTNIDAIGWRTVEELNETSDCG